MVSKSPRSIAAELLIRVSDNAFSNLALDGALTKYKLDSREKAFITRLFYGVTERRLTLDYIISLYSQKPLQKLDKIVLTALRCGIYQLLYMDSVPDSAAVNESAELVKRSGKSGAAGFVNAVLRSFIRGGKNFPLPEDAVKRMSAELSCPEELTERLIYEYGETEARSFLEASLKPHKLYLRANNTLTSADRLISDFAAMGVKAEKSIYDENCVSAEAFGSVEDNEMFGQGLYHVQDLSSQLCCRALGARENDLVLDICSAPGGKAFTIAENTEDKCTVYACDLYGKRVELIRRGAERLKLKSIKPLQNNARLFNESFPQFDRILCDVPCSGYGVIRSKPEIKYNPLSRAERLPQIQYEILSCAARYLKIGGELVYSTCTVLKEENDFVIDKFLENNRGFEEVEFLSGLGKPFGGSRVVIMDGSLDCEGFFMSKIRRIK